MQNYTDMKKIFVCTGNSVQEEQIIEILSSLYPEKVEFITGEIENEKADILIVSAENMLSEPPVDYKKKFGTKDAALIAVSKMQSNLVRIEADHKLQPQQILHFDEETEKTFDLLLN